MSGRGRLSGMALLAVIACNQPAGGSRVAGPGAGELVPTPTPAGTAAGAPAGVTIPASTGGSFPTGDGSLVIDVPPGALAEDTGFTITPITNEARGGVGPAFRLEPHGTTFDEPVTLTFHVPEAYAAESRFSALGVAYQDERRYWRAVEVVGRDASARTITVATTHFSDWALTWQTGTPAAEGPITLAQALGTEIPLAASGRATLYFQGDDVNDTVYVLTGTLTLPASFPFGDSTCVPDQPTRTLSPNVAELHKSDPPVFRWGLGVAWTITCTDPQGVATTKLVPAEFDTMGIANNGCLGGYGNDQIVQADRLYGSYTADCSGKAPGGSVTGTWDLRACTEGLPCETGVECRAGQTSCTGGIQSCADAGAVTDGTACGAGGAGTCAGGACVLP